MVAISGCPTAKFNWKCQCYMLSVGLCFGECLWVWGFGIAGLLSRHSFYQYIQVNLSFKRTHGWGLLSRFPPFRYFPNIWISPKYMLAIEYHVHIWQVLPQLSCGDTCQIWISLKECSRPFCEIENFAYGEIDERSFSNPHPRAQKDQGNHSTLHMGHCHSLERMELISGKVMLFNETRFVGKWNYTL